MDFDLLKVLKNLPRLCFSKIFLKSHPSPFINTPLSRFFNIDPPLLLYSPPPYN